MEGGLRLLPAAPSQNEEDGKTDREGFDKGQAKGLRNLIMAAKSQFRLKRKSRDSYLELVLDFPLASIKSHEHLTEAQRVIDDLLASDKLDERQEIYLDALSDLVGL